MVFEGKDWQTLLFLINNDAITLVSQRMPQQVLDAISPMIKAKNHYWHFWDKLLSDVLQLPDEGIHTLNTQITTLVSQCKFHHHWTQEILKLMVL